MKKLYSLFAMVIIVAASNGQGTNCNNAISIDPQATCIYQSFQTPAGSNVMWFFFVAESTNVNISVVTTKFGINAPHIHQLALGGGNCGNIVVLADDELPFEDDADKLSIDLNASGLIVGQTYFIRVKREATDTCDKVSCKANNSTDPTVFDLCVENVNVIIPLDFGLETPPINHAYHQNRGQLIDVNGNSRPDIKLYTINSNPAVYLSDTSVSYVFAKIDTDATTPDTMHRVDMTLEGTNSGTRVFKTEQIPGVTNYYLGHIPKGITRNKGFSRAVMNDVYSNIDMQFYSNSEGVKFYFIVKPGGDADNIVMKFDGATAVNVTTDSSKLEIITPLGILDFEAGHAYQINPGNQIVPMPWQAKFIKTAINKVKLDIRNYPQNMPLFIQIDRGHKSPQLPPDGNLEWSTHYGADGFLDYFYDVSNDDKGNIYIAGQTESANFPLAQGQIITPVFTGALDALVIKLDSNAIPKWVTFFGGSSPDAIGQEHARAVVADANGNVFAVGRTTSDDFPLQTNGNAFFDNVNSCPNPPYCWDIFIVKFDTVGVPLWSTYFGGEGFESASDLVLDNLNNLYVVGEGDSSSPLLAPSAPGAYFNSLLDQGGIIIKFDSLGVLQSAVLMGTNYGNGDGITAVAADSLNNIYITGYTTGIKYEVVNPDPLFPITKGPISLQEGVVSKFSEQGMLLWSMYYPGEDRDYGTGIAVDKMGNVFVTGFTQSDTIPLLDSDTNSTKDFFLGQHAGSYDAFLLKLRTNPLTGTIQILWSSYFGGTGTDRALNIAIDKNNYIYVLSATNSASLPFPAQFYPGLYIDTAYSPNTWGYDDIFISCFNPSLELLWSTYYGGNGDESERNGMSISDNKLYIVGESNTIDATFPLWDLDPNSNLDYYQPNGDIYWNGYAARFTLDPIHLIVGNAEISIPESGINIYPNPFTDNITISLPAEAQRAQAGSVEIYNIFGQKVFQTKIHNPQFTINFSKYSSGIYLIQVQTEKGLNNFKVIKQ